jgi:hypothetical protein
MGWRDRIANAILGGKVGGPTPTGIHVYHSSPHDFDRFDLGKIGTGEGAQVYGHGIYAAENPAVSGQGGQYWNQFSRRFGDDPEGTAASFLALEGFDRDKAIARVKDQVQRNREFHKTAYMPPDERADAIARNARLEESFRLLESGAPVGPRTYEVNFRAKPEELLDWDKPLPQQSPQVRGAMKNVESNLVRHWLADPDVYQSARGENIYEQLVGKHGKAEASAHLTDLGIPGIRYLDEGSRNIPTAIRDIEGYIKQGGTHKGAGADMWASRLDELKQQPLTHNYVAFDPSRLDIMAKYGVVGGVPLGALAATDQYGERQ